MDSFWDFFWLVLSFFLLMAYLVVMWQIVMDLFRDRSLGGVAKALWVFFLVALPLLTSLAYLVSRGPGMAERSLAVARSEQEAAESYVRSLAAEGRSSADEISRAKALLEAGTISETEFERLKQKALA
ncbi:MAG: SHOCT domain-containing protein [Nocardioides sp.]